MVDDVVEQPINKKETKHKKRIFIYKSFSIIGGSEGGRTPVQKQTYNGSCYMLGANEKVSSFLPICQVEALSPKRQIKVGQLLSQAVISVKPDSFATATKLNDWPSR